MEVVLIDTVWMLQTRYFAFHGYSILSIGFTWTWACLQGKSLQTSIEANELIGLKKVIDNCWLYKMLSLVGHSQGCLISLGMCFSLSQNY